MRSRVELTFVLTIVLVLGVAPGPVAAQVSGGLCPNPRNPACPDESSGVGIGAGSEEPASDAAPDPVDAGPVPATGQPCTYAQLSAEVARESLLAANDRVPMPAIFIERTCGEIRRVFWYVPGEGVPAEAREVHELVERALEFVEAEVPSLVTSPPLGSEVLTGLPMYLAVGEGSFGELSGSVSAGQFTVTASVVPVSSRFVPGDGGEPLECVGWGSVWSVGERPSEGDCTYTFTHTPVHLFGEGEGFEVSGRVVYEASYVVEGPVLAGEYDLGGFEGPEVVVEVPVVERRAVRTTAGG